MKKQKGQALVEFALIVPLFFAMCFGMIYGGITFLDYLQYNNAARAVARAISLTTDETQRETIANDFQNNNSNYIKPLTKLYEPTPKVTIATDVKVEIDLTLNEDGLPSLLLNWLHFPPKKLQPIEVVMPLENAN